MDSISKVNKICEDVLGLTQSDFQAVEQMAAEQAGYAHPLKFGTQAKFNELGEHNKRILAALKQLKVAIEGL